MSSAPHPRQHHNLTLAILVSAGIAFALQQTMVIPALPVLKLVAKLQVWNALPNGRSATFFNLWAGKRFRPARFRAELRADLTRVFELLRDGVLEPQIAARFPLDRAADALRFAEAGGFTGKVVLLPAG